MALPGEKFLIQRWEVPIPEAPDGIAIIGPDPDSEGNYLQHYFDSRDGKTWEHDFDLTITRYI